MLARLRASDAGPDPRFRAVLRERLVAAAGDRSDGPFDEEPFGTGPFDTGPFDTGPDEDAFDRGYRDLDCRDRGRADGRGDADG